MTNNIKGTIGILTGGGDVPGLNPAIRALTVRARREGYRVLGIRKGWEGMIRIDRDRPLEEQEYCQELTGPVVNKVGRTGGTFLHTSRTQPSKVKQKSVPAPLQDKYSQEVNDLTPDVIQNLDYLGIDHLIPIGGDDTLSYGVRLYQEGVKVVAIPSVGAVADANGDPLPASYLNFYIANGVVAVPTFGCANDEEAVAGIASCFPERRTVGLSARAILEGGGAFHCITQQEPCA